MPRMIQIRNVPDRLHRELVRRAKDRGQTLTQFIEEVLEREVSRPPAREVFERISRRSPEDFGKAAADLIAEERRRAKRA